MLKKKFEKTFSEQLEEARRSGDLSKWKNIKKRVSMAFNKEIDRLRSIHEKINKNT